jgi:hypothetical protein
LKDLFACWVLGVRILSIFYSLHFICYYSFENIKYKTVTLNESKSLYAPKHLITLVMERKKGEDHSSGFGGLSLYFDILKN